MTYNRDMQEDKEPLFEAADQLVGCLEMAREVATSVVLNPYAPLNDAQESWVVATDLAEALARAGMPFHQAHKLVGRLVLESIKEGKEPQDWDAETLQEFAPEFTPEIAKLLDPKEGMKSREILGGTGPEHVHALLRRAAVVEIDVGIDKKVTKSFRQGQILKLVRTHPVHTQEDLAKLLRSVGIEATQVTLSRDVRDLRLIKTPEGYRQVESRSGRGAGPQFELLAGEFLQDVKCAQNLVVLKTAPGHASSVAVALDSEEWPEVVGTIAGDDTILVIAPDNTTAGKVVIGYWRSWVSERLGATPACG